MELEIGDPFLNDQAFAVGEACAAHLFDQSLFFGTCELFLLGNALRLLIDLAFLGFSVGQFPIPILLGQYRSDIVLELRVLSRSGHCGSKVIVGVFVTLLVRAIFGGWPADTKHSNDKRHLRSVQIFADITDEMS